MLAFVWFFTGVNTLVYAQVVAARVKLAAGFTLKVGVGGGTAATDGLAENGGAGHRHGGGRGELEGEKFVLGRKGVVGKTEAMMGPWWKRG